MTPIEVQTQSTPAVEPARAPLPQPHAMRRHQRFYIAALLLAVLGILGLILFAKFSSEGAHALSAYPIVSVVQVERKDLQQTLTISAEFRPYEQASLHAKVAGYLQSISVDTGDHVREGQILAQLDVPELKDDLEKATAEVGASKEEVLRAEASYNDTHTATRRLKDVAAQHPKLVAEQDLDSSQAKDAESAGFLAVAKQKVAEATAEMNKVRSMMTYTTIIAPFAGVITKRYLDPGALVQAGTSSSAQSPVVDIAEDERLRLVFPVPESAVAYVKVGVPVRVILGTSGEIVQAKVSRFSGKVEHATRTMMTEVELDNSARKITPGMYASVEMVVRESKDAVAVPVQAVSGGDKPKVLIVHGDGTVEERGVKLGLETPFAAEVISGLAPGELVVTGNRSGIQPGQKVTPKLMQLPTTE